MLIQPFLVPRLYIHWPGADIRLDIVHPYFVGVFPLHTWQRYYWLCFMKKRFMERTGSFTNHCLYDQSYYQLTLTILKPVLITLTVSVIHWTFSPRSINTNHRCIGLPVCIYVRLQPFLNLLCWDVLTTELHCMYLHVVRRFGFAHGYFAHTFTAIKHQTMPMLSSFYFRIYRLTLQL